MTKLVLKSANNISSNLFTGCRRGMVSAGPPFWIPISCGVHRQEPVKLEHKAHGSLVVYSSLVIEITCPLAEVIVVYCSDDVEAILCYEVFKFPSSSVSITALQDRVCYIG